MGKVNHRSSWATIHLTGCLPAFKTPISGPPSENQISGRTGNFRIKFQGRTGNFKGRTGIPSISHHHSNKTISYLIKTSTFIRHRAQNQVPCPGRVGGVWGGHCPPQREKKFQNMCYKLTFQALESRSHNQPYTFLHALTKQGYDDDIKEWWCAHHIHRPQFATVVTHTVTIVSTSASRVSSSCLWCFVDGL